MESICEKYSEPRDRLLQVIIKFTKQVEPKPIWRAIVTALRSPAVNLPQLAMRVEAAHCTAVSNVPSEISTPIGRYNIKVFNNIIIGSVSLIRLTIFIIDTATRSEAVSHEARSEIPSMSPGEMVTGVQNPTLTVTVETAHYPDHTTTGDTSAETTTPTGRYICLRFTVVNTPYLLFVN